jgi:ABC-type Fe3+-siderophore transport system permease subunit
MKAGRMIIGLIRLFTLPIYLVVGAILSVVTAAVILVLSVVVIVGVVVSILGISIFLWLSYVDDAKYGI